MSSSFLFAPVPMTSYDAYAQSAVSDELDSLVPNHIADCMNATDSDCPFSPDCASFPSSHEDETTCAPLSPVTVPHSTVRPISSNTGRGRGRPKKLLFSTENPGKRAVVKARRSFHNDSAKRSRDRFNTALEDLWSQIPEGERLIHEEKKILARAEKVEITISYIRRLRTNN